MNNPLDFDGRVVLLAGGARETGKHIAETFLAAGAEVIICDSWQAENAPVAAGRRASLAAMDNGDPDQIEIAIDAIKVRYGRLDVLVYIAAAAPSLAQSTSNGAESDIRNGLITPLHFSRAANRIMQQQASGGSIINICRAGAPSSSPQPPAEDAASAGLANLGSSLSVEWAPRVRVNTVTIELTQTEHPALRESPAPDESSRPVSALRSEPQPIGKTCLFLASSMASYISGTRVFTAEK